MTLPDEECAQFVTAGWLKRVGDVPVDEVPAMVLEDPSTFTVLVGALRHARRQLAELTSDLVCADKKSWRLMLERDTALTRAENAESAIEVHVAERMRLAEDLAAMTAARDEACRIANVALGRLCHIEHRADWQPDEDRVAQLRKVGAP